MAATWPFAVQAQQVNHIPLVVVVLAFDQDDEDGKRYAAAFREALAQLGWAVGSNLKLEFRWNATNAERARAVAAEVMKLKPDLIVSHATIATRAITEQARTIPVVFANVSDPIGERFVQGFSRLATLRDLPT